MAETEKKEKSEFMEPKEVFRRAKGGNALNYALVPSKKRGEPPAFIVHRKKGPKQLLKAAKEQSGAKIGIVGTLTCTTKSFDLVCTEGKPTTMMAKQLRLFLKSAQLKQKVNIKAPDGSVIGDGEEDEEETGAEEAGGAAQAEAQSESQPAAQPDDDGQAAADPESSAEEEEEESGPAEDALATAQDELKTAESEMEDCLKRAEELGALRVKLEGGADPDAQTAALNSKGPCREAKETAEEAGEHLKDATAALEQAKKDDDKKLLQEAQGHVLSAQEKLESSTFSADKADNMMAEYAKAGGAAPEASESEDQAEEQAQAEEQEQQETADPEEERPAAAAKAADSGKKAKDMGPVKALLEQIKAEQKRTKEAVARCDDLSKLREKVAGEGQSDPDAEVAAMNTKGMVRDAVEAAQEADGYIKEATDLAKQAAQADGEDQQKLVKESEEILGGIEQKLEEVDYSAQRAMDVLSTVTSVSQEEDQEEDTKAEEEEESEAQASKSGDSEEEEAQATSKRTVEVPEELAKAVDNRQAFKKARALWVKARDQAVADLEQVKQGARNAYMDDLEQFPVVQRKLGDLDEIMDNLNDDLRVTLDAYVSTPLRNQQKMEELAEDAKQLLNGYMSYVKKSPLLDGIDQKEFANVTMKAPLLKALQQLERAIV